MGVEKGDFIICEICGEQGESYFTLESEPSSVHFQKLDEYEELCVNCFLGGMNLL